jgi:HEAT repeat protein
MTVFAFDRDWTVDVNPHPRHEAVPLEWVRHLAHETSHPVYAIGNQDLAEEAAIPGVVDIVGRHDDDWEQWLGDKMPSGRYEQFPERRERLSLIADLHPEAEDFIVIDDLDLSDVGGWEHYHAWEFVPAVEQGLIDPDLPWVEDMSADGGLPTMAGIMPADPIDLASFLNEYADAPGYDLEYEDDGTEQSELCLNLSLDDKSTDEPTLQCTPINPTAAEFDVEFENIELLSVVEPPPEAFIADVNSLAEKATAFRRLSEVHPDTISISSVLGILDRADGPRSRDEDALKALQRVAAVRPEDCTPAIPILRTLLTLDDPPGQEDVLLTLARIGGSDAEAIAPLSDDIMPYLETDAELGQTAAARCLAIIAAENPEDAVDAAPQLAAIIESEADAECQKQAVYGLSRITKEHPEAVIPHAESLKSVVLDDGTADTVRLNATAALGRTVSEDPAIGIDMVEELVELFDAENPKLRNNAIGLISDVATVHTDVVESFSEEIAALLEADDTYTRINATAALSRVAEDFPATVATLTPTFIDLLDDDNSQVRQNTCWALGHLEAQEATERLETASTADTDSDVRSRASWALTKIRS